MKRNLKLTLLSGLLVPLLGCESKNETVSKGREAVKEVVTQPFNALDTVKGSLRQSADNEKAALEQVDKEIK